MRRAASSRVSATARRSTALMPLGRLSLLAAIVIAVILVIFFAGGLDPLRQGSARSEHAQEPLPNVPARALTFSGNGEVIPNGEGAEREGEQAGAESATTSSERCGEELYGTPGTGCPFARQIVAA